VFFICILSFYFKVKEKLFHLFKLCSKRKINMVLKKNDLLQNQMIKKARRYGRAF